MLRSLLSAITALQDHQTYLDVISNNIANVNTTGFKESRIAFEDILNQTIHSGTAPTVDRGGTNPSQVGLGVKIGGIDVIQTQGDLQTTGKVTDLAINGDGYFMVNDGQTTRYTRDGNFNVGADGYLVNSATGQRVQGWLPNVLNASGVPQTNSQGIFLIDSTQPTGDIQLPLNATAPAKTTTIANLVGNLSATTPVDSTLTANNISQSQVDTTVVVYDSLGRSHNINLTFERTNQAANNNTWMVTATGDSTIGSITLDGGPQSQLTFDDNGNLTQPVATPNTPAAVQMQIQYNDIANPQNVALNVGSVTQLASASGVNLGSQDGYAAGNLLSFDIGQDGQINGVFTNGATQVMGQIALAKFPNPGGLVRSGSNDFELGVNSGLPIVGAPSQSGLGSISSGELEMSNVNLAEQFTDMIQAERGFQANARVITTSDQILQDLIGLKASP